MSSRNNCSFIQCIILLQISDICSQNQLKNIPSVEKEEGDITAAGIICSQNQFKNVHSVKKEKGENTNIPSVKKKKIDNTTAVKKCSSLSMIIFVHI